MFPSTTCAALAATRSVRWLAFMAVIALLAATTSPERSTPRMVGMADLDTLTRAYQRWQGAQTMQPTLSVPLGYSRALSSEYSEARGRLKVNMQTGRVQLSLDGLPKKRGYTLWWVDNQPGAMHSVKPESGDRFLEVGRFQSSGNRASWETTIDPKQLTGFDIDLVVVTNGNADPSEGLLFGAPTAFQALQRSLSLGSVEPDRSATSDPLAKLEFLLPRQAVATGSGKTLKEVLGEKVALGRRLFLNETFDGNGRTCGTCHRPENNHTIDPAYIAKLPQHDPLFVAETNPALKDLEKPQLMRRFGLILANLDGFESDRPPVMRSVPHLLGLSNSIAVEPEDMAATENALGWSGDGSPSPGSLKLFSVGAIKQHFPKTLDRVAGTDFRLPTDEELEAIELYMLSLGRGPGEETVLATTTFTNEFVEKGKLLFDTKENPLDTNGNPILGTTGNCNGCHQNAGANSSTTHANPTRDTGIEALPNHPARRLDPTMALDGGFGTEPNTCGPPEAAGACFGDRRFNTPSLIEAADTGPYFHNNVVKTLEEAIAAYNEPSFNQSPGALTSSGKNRQIALDTESVNAIGAFLRTLNALDNIRSSNKLGLQARELKDGPARQMTRLALAETRDAVQVLKQAKKSIYPRSVALLQHALELEQHVAQSDDETPRWWRNAQLSTAIALKDRAAALMVQQP